MKDVLGGVGGGKLKGMMIGGVGGEGSGEAGQGNSDIG